MIIKIRVFYSEKNVFSLLKRFPEGRNKLENSLSESPMFLACSFDHVFGDLVAISPLLAGKTLYAFADQSIMSLLHPICLCVRLQFFLRKT